MTRTLFLAKVPLQATPEDICAEFTKLDATVVSGIYYGTFNQAEVPSGLGFVTFESAAACEQWLAAMAHKHTLTPYLVNPPASEFKPLWHNAILICGLPDAARNEAAITDAIQRAYADFQIAQLHLDADRSLAIVKFTSHSDQQRALREVQRLCVRSGPAFLVQAQAAVPDEGQNALVLRDLPAAVGTAQGLNAVTDALEQAYAGYRDHEVAVQPDRRSAVVTFASAEDRDRALRERPAVQVTPHVWAKVGLPVAQSPRLSLGNPEPPRAPEGGTAPAPRSPSFVECALAVAAALPKKRFSQVLGSEFDSLFNFVQSHWLFSCAWLCLLYGFLWIAFGPTPFEAAVALLRSLWWAAGLQLLVFLWQLGRSRISNWASVLTDWQALWRLGVVQLTSLGACALLWLFPHGAALLLRICGCAWVLLGAAAIQLIMQAFVEWVCALATRGNVARDQLTTAAKRMLVNDAGPRLQQVLGFPYWTNASRRWVQRSSADALRLWPLLVAWVRERGAWRSPGLALPGAALLCCFAYVLAHHRAVLG
jgi:hypothetical protein